jgi:hypothetical protein
MRVKLDFVTGSRANYKDFCNKHKDIRISPVEWKSIIYSFNEKFRDYLLETGEPAKLPNGLGPFMVVKKKRKPIIFDENGIQRVNLPIDWKKTKEKGKVVYHMNYDTEGYVFKYFWGKDASKLPFPELWRFIPSRPNNRLLRHYIQQGSEYTDKYCEVSVKPI